MHEITKKDQSRGSKWQKFVKKLAKQRLIRKSNWVKIFWLLF